LYFYVSGRIEFVIADPQGYRKVKQKVINDSIIYVFYLTPGPSPSRRWAKAWAREVDGFRKINFIIKGIRKSGLQCFRVKSMS